jgi:hypothetical protein
MTATIIEQKWPELETMLDGERYGRDRLTIVGGKVAADELAAFLQNWSWPTGHTRWEYWQHASEIRLTANASLAAADVGTLERARLFGEGGDLSLRRDGHVFHWRFVGPAGSVTPPGAGNYWDRYPGKEFRCTEQTVLLWGQRQEIEVGEARWLEDRVRWAQLHYPGVVAGHQGRAALRFKSFTHAGQEEFVWYYALEPWQAATEDQDG